MKFITPALLTLLVAVGCASDPVTGPSEFLVPDPTPPPATAPPATTAPVTAPPVTLSPVDASLEDLIDRYPTSAFIDDSTFLSMGETVCSGIEDLGVDLAMEASFQGALDAGFDPGHAGAIVAYVIIKFCPQHLPAAADWAGS